MKPLLLFRTVDSNDQPAELPGIDDLVALLKKSKSFSIEYREGTVNNLSALNDDRFILLAADAVQLRSLPTMTLQLRQQLFLLGCGYSVLNRLDQLRVAGAIPDLEQLHASGAYFAYGNKFPLDALDHGKPAVTTFYSSFPLALKETKTAAGISLSDYLGWYARMSDGLWAGETNVSPSPAVTPPLEQKSSAVKPAKESKYNLGDWKSQQSELRKKLEEAGGKNDLADRSRLTPEQLDSWEREQEQKRREEEEREQAIPLQLRAAVLDARFRSRPEVKMLIEKKDEPALLAAIENEMAATYILQKFQRSGWPEPKVRRNIQVLRKVGKERDSLRPEEVGERKIILLENSSQWVQEAKIDMVLTKTLMEKLDPEVMVMLQGRQFTDPGEALRGLDQVRGLMRKISSGDASLRFQYGNLRIPNFNTSYWGNEKQVTLALRPGEEGWTDYLPFTDGELQQLVNELLKEEASTVVWKLQ